MSATTLCVKQVPVNQSCELELKLSTNIASLLSSQYMKTEGLLSMGFLSDLSNGNEDVASKNFEFEFDDESYSLELGCRAFSGKYPARPYSVYLASSIAACVLNPTSRNTKVGGYGTLRPPSNANRINTGVESLHTKYAAGDNPYLETGTQNQPTTNTFDEDLFSFLTGLSNRDVLCFMGVAATAGSVDVLPPPVEVLITSFNKLNSVKSKLTAGARALAKHCHRSSECWWGTYTGSEQRKNSLALDVILRILSDVAWINMHYVPHDIKVVEVRCSEGYGARWVCDGTEFRGFLEPQIEDGHAVKWRH